MAMFMSINGECVGVDTGPERGATRCNYSITQRNVAFVFRDIFADKKKLVQIFFHIYTLKDLNALNCKLWNTMPKFGDVYRGVDEGLHVF
jgi:hypothetical protein